MSEKLEIKELYAFVAIDDEGGEGIPAQMINDMFMPLIGADFKRVECLLDLARNIATLTGVKIELRKFSAMEVLQTINVEH